MKRVLVFVGLLVGGLVVLFLLAGESPWTGRSGGETSPPREPEGAVPIETLAPRTPARLGGAKIQPEGEVRVTTADGVRIDGVFEETHPDGRWVLRDVVIGIPRAEGTTAEVTARRAIGRFAADAGGGITAEGSPIHLEGVAGTWVEPGRTDEPIRFETDEAEVELEQRWLRAPGRAAVAMGEMRLEGRGLEADLPSGRYRFAREIRFERRAEGEETAASCGGPALLFLDPVETAEGRLAELELQGDVDIERRQGDEVWNGRAQRFFARALLPRREETRREKGRTPFRLRHLRLDEGVEIEGEFGTLLSASFEAGFDEGGRLERFDAPAGARLRLADAGPLGSGSAREGLTVVECRGGIEAWRSPSSGTEAILPGPTRIHSPDGLLPTILRGPATLLFDPASGSGGSVESVVAMGSVWLRRSGAFAHAPVAEIESDEVEDRLRLGPAPLLALVLPGESAPEEARFSCGGWAEVVSTPGGAFSVHLERDASARLGESRALDAVGIRITREETGSRIEAEGEVRLRDAALGLEARGDALQVDEREGFRLEGSPGRLSLSLEEGRVTVRARRILGGEDGIEGEGAVSIEFPPGFLASPGRAAPEATATASGERFRADLDRETRRLRTAWLEGGVVVDAGDVHGTGDRLDIDRETGEHRLTARDLVSVRGSSTEFEFEATAPLARFVEKDRSVVLEPRGTIAAMPPATGEAPGAIPLPADSVRATFEGTARLGEDALHIEGRVAAEGDRGADEPWSLEADLLDVRFGPGRRAEEVRASGAVHFRSGETFRAWGDEVVYEPDSGIVRGRGRPARFDLGRGQLLAEGVDYDLRRRLVLRVERGTIELSR